MMIYAMLALYMGNTAWRLVSRPERFDCVCVLDLWETESYITLHEIM